MPDFTARLDSGPSLSIEPWDDPAIPEAPSRLNSIAAHQHKYVRVEPTGSVVARATLDDGTEAPMDVDLDGRLFLWSWVQWSGNYPPVLVPAAAQSSEVSFELHATHLGFFALLCSREDGGSVVIQFSSEA